MTAGIEERAARLPREPVEEGHPKLGWPVSVLVVALTVAVAGALLGFERRSGPWWVAFGVATAAAAASFVVLVLKRSWATMTGTGRGALVAAPLFLVVALRQPARSDSPWARWFYDDARRRALREQEDRERIARAESHGTGLPPGTGRHALRAFAILACLALLAGTLLAVLALG